MLYIVFKRIPKEKDRSTQLVSAGIVTTFYFLLHEWSWQIGTALKWGLLNPNLDWIQYQICYLGPVPFWVANNLFYITLFTLIFQDCRKTASRFSARIFTLPFLLLVFYEVIFNLVSPSVVFNDYGYATKLSSQVFSSGEKIFFLIWEYFLPKILLVGSVCLVLKQPKTHANKNSWASYWKKNPLWRRLGARIVNYLQYLNMPNAHSCVLEVGCGVSSITKNCER